MMSRYQYVGASDLNNQVAFNTIRTPVTAETDILAFLRVVVTFVVDTNGLLWIADRQSEHVACARGGDVLSAGEMTFEADNGKVVAVEVTNQSTGYCPEPESWPSVAAALDKAAIRHPNKFTRPFLFRLCESCGQINIVKEGDFMCAICGTELNQEWNFTHGTRAKKRQRTRRASAV